MPKRGIRSTGRFQTGRRKRFLRQYPGARVIPGYTRRSGYYRRYTLAQQMMGEKKFKDTDVDDAAIAAGMTFHNLTVIQQGDTESERIGRKITVRNINVKGHVTLAPATSAANSTNIIKFSIVQDKQTNGAQFTALDLLETDTIDSYRNLANMSRFKVLGQKYVYVSAGGGAPTGAAYTLSQDSKWFKFNIKCHVPIEYDNSATTGAITTVRSNNLYLVTQSINGTGAASTGTARLRYTDM